ncbi:MAG TPA: M61 family peptidase [Verrucomicrobiae bacterium]|nr:M61 family peptidase [Verrucomicrobiae bacterium]
MKSRYVLLVFLLVGAAAIAQSTIHEALQVDATDAPRNILHAVVTIPVSTGPATLVYPKWIPGNHRPTGPINNVMDLHIRGNGQEINWQRDLEDMYAVHLQVPAGINAVEVSFDTVTYNGTRSLASGKVLDLLWNQVVFYPQGFSSDNVLVTASLRLPEGWKFGTALDLADVTRSSQYTAFQEVSLTRLVDSPLIAGAIYRQIQLSAPGETPVHVIDMVGESDAAIQITDKDVASYKQLVAEAGKLFGARHYGKYHFLYTLSDQTNHHGLEHHESSDNGSGEETFSDEAAHNLEADLLPHEFTHSWNGKYRRPKGLATANYQEPMHGDLLWVYEGLTDYLGDILAARVGLRSPEQFRENAAYTAAMLDHRAGRSWRPLQDTATSVQMVFGGQSEWANWRRSADYYPEGFLLWLEIDTMIRNQTREQKSLNDFCRSFFGGESGPPKIVPYTFDDVVAALNQVAPYDWAAHLRERLDSKSPHAPLGGMEKGGWKLVYSSEKNTTMQAAEKTGDSLDLSFSLGMIVAKDGTLRDVIHGSPAYAAGLGPGMKLLGVNGRKWSKETIRAALRAAVNNRQPLALMAENADYYNVYQVDYHGGEQYPHLVRDEKQPDVLGQIIQPMAAR